MFSQRKIRIFIFFLVWALHFLLPADAAEYYPTASLNLSGTLHIALTRHADLIIANERVIQALAGIDENASMLLPQLKGVVSETRQTRDLRSTGLNLPGDPLVGPFNVYDARLRLTQTLFDPSAVARFKASRQGHAVLRAEQKKIQEDVLVLVAALFIEAKRSQDKFLVEDLALRREKKEIYIVSSRFKSGISSSLEMKKARVRYAHALSGWERSKSQALKSRLDLLSALDLPLDTDIHFVWDKDIFSKEILPVDTTESQPDVSLAKEQLKLRQQEHAANKWDFWPKISLSGEYGPSGTTPNSHDSSETYALGVAASIPFFEGGLRQAKLHISESALRVSQVHLQDEKRTLQAKLTSQYESLMQAKAFVLESQKNLVVADEELVLIRSKYRCGNASSLDVSSADVNWQFAHDQKQEALAFELLAKINYARLSGRVEEFLLDKK